MTGKWEKLKSIMDDSDSPWHGYDVTDLMDRLEREEAAEPSEHRCVTRMGSTYAYLADGTKIEAHRAPDAKGRMWIEHKDQSRVKPTEVSSAPVPIPSAEACEAVVYWQDCPLCKGAGEQQSPSFAVAGKMITQPCRLCGGRKRQPVCRACGTVLHPDDDAVKRALHGGGLKPRPRIVCLCGSTRFMDQFHAAGWQFTLDGEIVLSVGVCKHAADHGGEALGQDVADRLDVLHLRKIDLCDHVFVLNVGGYIGSSTRKEIEYAEKIGKPVEYLESLHGGGKEKG